MVAEILTAQEDGPVSQLNEEKKAALIACVNETLSALPEGRKRFVMEGDTFEEREKRFGTVVMADRAAWKQKIARACASITAEGA